MARLCIYDILVIIKNYFTNYLKYPEKLLQKLAEVGLKENAENSFPDAQKLSTLVSELENTG